MGRIERDETAWQMTLVLGGHTVVLEHSRKPSPGCERCGRGTYSRCLACNADVCGDCLVLHECDRAAG